MDISNANLSVEIQQENYSFIPAENGRTFQIHFKESSQVDEKNTRATR